VNRAVLVTLASLVLAGAAPAPEKPPSPGVYRQTHVIEFYRGPAKPSDRTAVEDVLEVVAIDSSHYYVRSQMAFDNGHSCGVYGVATQEGDALIYRPRHAFGGHCVLGLRRKGGRAVFEDPDGSCRLAYCGARGMLDGSGFALSSRRPIRYMKRLLASRQYADAIAEWHENH
jgi:hypothetical protein